MILPYSRNQKKHSIKYHIKNGDWERAQEILTCEYSTKAHTRAMKTDSSGRTLLHIMCSSKPPIHVVEYLMERFPNMAEVKDKQKRLPLHIAVESGASPQVISCLLDANKMAANQLDVNGKSPLHLAFDGGDEYWCDNGEGDLLIGPLLNVVEMLSGAAPLMISHEDKNGITPLEKAIINGMVHDFISLLQKNSMLKWKSMEKDGSLAQYQYLQLQRQQTQSVFHGRHHKSFMRRKNVEN